MKRFILFAYSHYYPLGGWHDFRGAFDTIEEAVAARKAKADKYDYAEWHVFDSVEMRIVEGNDTEL